MLIPKISRPIQRLYFSELCMFVKKSDSVYESDNLSIHKMRAKRRSLEKSVDNRAFEYITTEDNGMVITLEFPRGLQDDSIISEVKNILAGMLNEYFENVS